MRACLVLGACLAMPKAVASDLEADLSTHYIEIRTTFRGAQLTVFGAITEQSSDFPERPSDVIVVVRGPPEAIAVRRKEELGPIWANRTSFIAESVPSFYYVASTRPVDDIVDASSLDRYRIGLDHLGLDLVSGAYVAKSFVPLSSDHGASSDDEVAFSELDSAALPSPLSAPALPSAEDSSGFRAALIRLLEERQTFSTSGQLTFVRPHLFRAEVNIPSTVPQGTYGAEVYLVRGKEVVDAEYTAFYIDKKGLEGKIYELAEQQPVLHGLLGVVIAVAAGWISELAFRRR